MRVGTSVMRVSPIPMDVLSSIVRVRCRINGQSKGGRIVAKVLNHALRDRNEE